MHCRTWPTNVAGRSLHESVVHSPEDGPDQQDTQKLRKCQLLNGEQYVEGLSR